MGETLQHDSMKATVLDKGQITIPKALRNKLGLATGTVLKFVVAGDKLVGTKEISRDPTQKWIGRGHLPGGMSVDEYLVKARDNDYGC